MKLLSKIQDILSKHFVRNINTYFFLFLSFVIGVSAGAFTVNGLSTAQNEELSNYFHGFLKLLDKQDINGVELLKAGLADNLKIILVLWGLGVTIIGIPFIYVIVGIRGFITGFTSGFIIKVLGAKGMLFVSLSLLPKEMIIVPAIIAMGVSGINFSLTIIKNKSLRHLSRENLKTNFVAYCFVTLLFCSVILVGITIDMYMTPVFIRMISPIVT